MFTSRILILLFLLVSGQSYIPASEVKGRAVDQYKNNTQPRMFLITVIDSKDDTIGERCEKDMDEVIYSFEELADWLGVEMEEPKIIKGEDFSKAAVNDALENWLPSYQPTRSDIVVFYYSGHGFRFPGDASDYPRMWLKTASERNTETTNLRIEEDIYDRLVTRGAGVTIVLSDCCNTSVAGDNGQFDEVKVPVRKRIRHKKDKPEDDDLSDDTDNADKLFVETRPLSILATAAGKGEFAGGKTEVGGFFTNYFLEALNECIYETRLAPTWENIFRYVDENAGYWARSAACPNARHNGQKRCIQIPKVKIVTGD